MPAGCADRILLHLRRDPAALFVGRHQELEHELLTGSSTVIRKSLESRSLPLIESSISLGVEAHQRLGECRLEGLDVLRECVAVFELELVRTAFFCR